jgi:hypothetical protein
MSLVGLDLNATRAWAVVGSAGAAAHPLMLDGNERALPMQISLQHRHAEVGRPGLALCRRLPHLVCADFLAALETPKLWSAGRHRLDSARALTLVFERLRQACSTARGFFLAVPAYLTREQGAALAPVAAKARLPWLGSIAAPMAAALSAYAASPWSGPALVLDVDNHALTATLLASSERPEANDEEDAPDARVRVPTLSRTQVLSLPQLGLRVWKNRLIDAVADRCVRQSRRDPRDSAAAEQMLFEQLEDVLDACWQERMVEAAVRTGEWSQNFVLRPEEVRAACLPLVQQSLAEIRELLTAVESPGVGRVLATEAAGRLPGLCEAIEDEVGDAVPLIPLAADAAALGAHEVAAHFLRNGRPPEHLDAAISCPVPASPEPEPKKRLFGF